MALLLAAGSVVHGALYPSTFNAHPPAAILSAPEPAPALITPGPGGRDSRGRLALVVVDGLRDDAAATMGLESATTRGGDRPAFARCTLEAEWPSFSKPGYATIATGAPPTISGVHTNRFQGPVELDNLFARADAAGRSVGAVSDESDDWGQLFPEDLCFEESGADAFARATGTLFDDAVPECDFTLLHTVIVDDAAHASGAASPAYARAVASTGEWLRASITRMNPARDTLVITSDHGHIDRGGHGGTESVVLRVPFILIGRGVRDGAPAGACSGRRLSDVAPTVAALLGVEPPHHAVGSVLRPLLALDPAALDAADAAGLRSRAALAEALATGRDGRDGGAPEGVLAAEVRPRGIAYGGGLLGLLIAAGTAWLLLLVAGPATDACTAAGGPAAGDPAAGDPAASRRGRERLRCCVTALAYPILAWAILLLVEPGASFSAKREPGPDYSLRIVLLLSAAAVAGFGAQLLAFRNADPDVARRARAVALALAVASWPIVVGLHGSLFGAPLGEPHLSFAVVLACLVSGVGCLSAALILSVDTALGWRGARRRAVPQPSPA